MLLAVLIALFAITATGALRPPAVVSAYASVPQNEPNIDEHERGGYTLNEIRAMLQEGDSVGYKRVYQPDSGPVTYEMAAEELLEIFGAPNDIQSFNNFSYAVRPIIGGGRPCDESIVLVLLGDGFTAGNGHGQVGNYWNPGAGTFLRSAYDFAETLITRYPFSLFRDMFKIYAVETPSTQGIRVGTAANPITAPYPGTYLGSFFSEPGSMGISMTRSAHALDISNWVSSNSIMTQVLLNTTEFGGVAFWTAADYTSRNSLGITARVTGIFHHWDRPRYHFIMVHEIGHNFGQLVDEHTTGFGTPNWANANMARTTDTDAQLKWGHWLGHAGITRRTANAPAGYIFPSTNNTCIMQGWNASFCAVCRAELSRRMAMINGETFEAGRRPDGTVRPATPNITIPSQHNRILPYAFNGNTSLQTIHIPASVTTIGNFAFIGATGLRTIVNDRTVPQRINDTTFRSLNRANITVIIPIGTTQAYINAG